MFVFDNLSLIKLLSRLDMLSRILFVVVLLSFWNFRLFILFVVLLKFITELSLIISKFTFNRKLINFCYLFWYGYFICYKLLNSEWLKRSKLLYILNIFFTYIKRDKYPEDLTLSIFIVELIRIFLLLLTIGFPYEPLQGSLISYSNLSAYRTE